MNASNNRESGWLIERYLHSELNYWTGEVFSDNQIDTSGAFSKDHNKALRFARAQDAGLFLAHFLGGVGRVAQHVWIGGQHA